MKTKSLAITAALLALAAQPALAHRFWIIPSSSVLSGEKPWVTVDAAISNNLFFPDHAAPGLEWLTVTGPKGQDVKLQNGTQGKYRTTFDIELADPGTYVISTVRNILFATYLEDGEQKRWRGTEETLASEGIKDKENLQLNRSSSRVETFVTAGEPTPIQPSGKGLELIIGETHPNDLYAGEDASFTLHFDGKPAANCEIVLVKGDDRYRDEPGETKITTDENGKFTLNFPTAGRYWLNANTSGESGEVAGIPAGSRVSYTATFEVLPQ